MFEINYIHHGMRVFINHSDIYIIKNLNKYLEPRNEYNEAIPNYNFILKYTSTKFKNLDHVWFIKHRIIMLYIILFS